MKGSLFIICIISLVLVLGTLLAGCTQSPSSNQTQSSTNVFTTEQTTTQSTPVTNIIANPTQTSYSVSINVNRQDQSTIAVSYEGGQSAPYLQHITILANDVIVGYMTPPTGQLFLPVGMNETFPAMSHSHVVLYGHFLNGGVQSIFDKWI
jgi:hypothetical protein